jgi:hypothetical protein
MSVTLSDLTISGVSVGDGGETPPASDPYWANVSLLTETTNINGANNFTLLDSSSNNFSITNDGASVTQGTFGPVAAAASGYFPSRAQSAHVTTDNFSYSTGDFTIEAWVYPTATFTGMTIFSQDGDTRIAGTYTGQFAIDGGNNKLQYNYYTSSSSQTTILVTTSTILPNTWTHVAISRSGTSVKMFINGIAGYSDTIATMYQGTCISGIGCVPVPTASKNFSGYISDLRVTNTAVYTSNFSVPTAPLTAIAGTKLLMSFDNAGIYDAAAKNDMFTKYDAQVSTTQAKFGTTSIKLDGTGDYVSMPSNTDLQIVGGDFTIESWIYATSTSLQQMINQDDGTSTNQTFTVRMESNGSLGFIYYTGVSRGSAITRTTSNTIPLNVWTNIAVSRTGSTLKMFINGVQGYSGTATSMYQGSVPTTLGAFTNGAYGYNFNGYMQDVRITKGVGRYTTDFTPPTQPFPTN